MAFSGWGDMTDAAAAGFKSAADAAPTAISLSPFVNAQYAGVGNVAPMTATQLLKDRQAFADPYMQSVVDSSLAGYDQTAGMTRAAQAANAARNGAFGGSRYGVREALTEGQLALGRGQLESGLRSNAWNTAMGFSQNLNAQNQQSALQRAIADAQLRTQTSIANAQGQNAYSMQQASLDAQLAEAQRARQLQALSLLGDTANSYAGNDRADLSLLADLGNQQRQIEQQQALAVPTALGIEGQLYNSVPLSMFTGQTVDSTGDSTTTESGGLLGSILGGLAKGVGGKI